MELWTISLEPKWSTSFVQWIVAAPARSNNLVDEMISLLWKLQLHRHLMFCCQDIVSTRAQYRSRRCFLNSEELSSAKYVTLLQNPRNMCGESSTGACLRLSRLSLFTTDTSKTLEFTRSHGTRNNTAYTTIWTHHKIVSSYRFNSTLGILLSSQINGSEKYFYV